MNRNVQDVFEISKWMVYTNLDIIGEQSISNDNGVLAFRDEDKKLAWEIYLESLLNTERARGWNRLSQADAVCGVIDRQGHG